MKRTSG
jgi:hypothetical protein